MEEGGGTKRNKKNGGRGWVGRQTERETERETERVGERETLTQRQREWRRERENE